MGQNYESHQNTWLTKVVFVSQRIGTLEVVLGHNSICPLDLSLLTTQNFSGYVEEQINKIKKLDKFLSASFMQNVHLRKESFPQVHYGKL